MQNFDVIYTENHSPYFIFETHFHLLRYYKSLLDNIMVGNLHCGGVVLYQVSTAEFHSSAETVSSVRQNTSDRVRY